MASGVAISGQQLFAALLVDCVIVCSSVSYAASTVVYSYKTSALTFYEYFITIEQEIRVIWRRKFTGATLLFIINRYATLLLAVLILASLSSGDERSCSITRKVIEILVTILSLTFLAFSTLRTYAIAGHNRLLWTVPVLILTLVPIPIDVFYWTISRDFYVRNPHACVRVVNLPTKQLAIGTELAYRGSLCVANFIMLSLVLQRTLHIYLQSRAFKIRTPLVQALLRDGAVFFFTFLILNLITLLAEFVPALVGLLPTGSLLQEVTSILLSRFMLNLRQTSEASGGTDGPSPSRFTANATAIDFRIPQSVIANLAESFAEEAEIDYEPENEVPSTSSPFNDKGTLQVV